MTTEPSPENSGQFMPTGTVIMVKAAAGQHLAVVKSWLQLAGESGVRAGYLIVYDGQQFQVHRASGILDRAPTCSRCGTRQWWWPVGELLLPTTFHCARCEPPPRQWESALLRLLRTWHPTGKMNDADLELVREIAHQAFEEANWSRFQQVVFSVELAQSEKNSTITVHRASEPDFQAGPLPL